MLSPPRLHVALLMIWLPLLLAVQSIPGTGALRTLLLVCGIIHVIRWKISSGTPISLPRAGAEKWLLIALLVWLAVQSAFFASQVTASLANLAREWFKLLLMGGLGLALARLCKDHWRWLALALFAGAFVHVIATLGFQLLSLARGQGVIYGMSLLGNYGYVAPFTTTAFAWLLADIAARLSLQKALFPWPAPVSAILTAATLVAETFLNAKASHVMIVMLVSSAVVILLARRQSRGNILLGAILLSMAATVAIYTGKERWLGASEAVRLAWEGPADVESFTGSSDPQARVNRLEQSFYLRMVWARMGLEGIAENPFGLGYGPDAFGRYVAQRYGISGAVSSHSGWIDFALANGILGLALLLALGLAAMHRGWQSFVKGHPLGLALILLILHYVCRAALDGILSGSRLTGFACVAVTLWTICAPSAHAPHSDQSTNAFRRR